MDNIETPFTGDYASSMRNGVKTAKFTMEKQKNQSIVNFSEITETDSQDEEDVSAEYNPYKISQIQKYNPVYSLFFPVSKEETDFISLNQTYEITDFNQIQDAHGKIHVKPTFMKFSPLLDPVRFIIGKYKEDMNIVLPSIENWADSASTKTKEKLGNIHNASYVDTLFCYLSGQLLNTHQFIHGVQYYGSYLGIQEKFKLNITDDLDYLYGHSYFREHINTMFTLSEHNEFFLGQGSRKNKQKLSIQTQEVLLEVESIEGGEENTEVLESSIETVYQNEHTETVGSHSSDNSSDNSQTNRSSDSEEDDSSSESSSSSSEEEDSDSDSDSEDEKQVYAYIYDFPVQVICMEKCDGTIDDLFSQGKINEKEGASALFQVIMSLIVYQKAFHFTHNDLHTNNIMYVHTQQQHILYTYKGKHYKVPTYGKIYKIIDFGRGIYQFQDKLLCSDSFFPGGDASTQYNCEPFYNPEKPVISPNYSFDLCRLGCSIYDFIIDDEKVSDMDAFQQTIHRWCLDDQGKNILYKKDGTERYPQFKLYKMIARTVHRHTPEEQLKFPFFSQFETQKLDKKSIRVDMDAIPCYV